MADYDGLTPGQVLADASVAEFIKTLGLSIAEAQQALDENSVDQIGEFLVPRESLGGKTLLDLGLSPAFYHYQHADISCSLQLSLRVEKDLSVGLNLNGSYSDNQTSNSNQSDSSESTESGTTTATRERTAEVSIESASTGALSIGGRSFNLSGDDPLTRIRALQDAVMNDAEAGVPRLLYEPGERSFVITTDADAEKVQTTDKTVVFNGGGFDRCLIQIDTNSATDYVFNGSVTVNTTAQASLEAYANHVEAQVRAAGYNAGIFPTSTPIYTTHFRTGRHHLETFDVDGTTYNDGVFQSLSDLASFARAHNYDLDVEGFADAQSYQNQSESGSDQSNIELGNRRADEVIRVLLANGMEAGKVHRTASRGRAAAQAAGGPADNVAFRKAEVRIRGRSAYLLIVHSTSASLTIVDIAPDKTAPGSSGNGFVWLYRPQALSLSGKKVSIDGTDFLLSGASAGGHAAGSPSAYAQNLKNAINANAGVDFSASAEANMVTVFGKSTPFRLTLISSEQRSIQLSGSEGITITRSFTRTESSSLTRQNTGNRAVAVGASLDVRYSRQFEMNVSGNSAISARLVSIPAPPEFLETIKSFLTPND
ncbi:OmpA family protein [Marinobacterium lutimaris]|uniref:OmpA family protein n=1 Tax=Marinobacterium lutimaris TaxID=568106 RepID=A0A1H5XH51_9GAMM|nr:OmpA family protein [Marinobacterium lutimaris]SEG11154.1 OmpA family protein [Marinobacterium lutimaris]